MRFSLPFFCTEKKARMEPAPRLVFCKQQRSHRNPEITSEQDHFRKTTLSFPLCQHQGKQLPCFAARLLSPFSSPSSSSLLSPLPPVPPKAARLFLALSLMRQAVSFRQHLWLLQIQEVSPRAEEEEKEVYTPRKPSTRAQRS